MTDPGGSVFSRRRFMIGGAFLAAAGIAWARQPTRRVDYLGKRKLDDLIPKQVGGWRFQTASGLVVPPEDELSKALYSELLTRVYVNEAGEGVMLLVAQSAGQTGVLQIHRPEVCYPAGGYRLSVPEVIRFDAAGKPLDATVFTAEGGSRTEQLLYWTRVGNHMPTSWRQQREAVAIDNLKGYVPDAVLVRASMLGDDRDAAVATLERFVATLLETLSSDARKVLVA